jgi:hypothetical protein
MFYILYSLSDTEQVRSLGVTGNSSYILFINNSLCESENI